jgi:bifunctional non-homologous end joining protein LigD
MGWLPRFVLPRKWCSALRSRNNLSFNDKFRTVTSALENWKINAVVDGEVVVLNEEGHADFEALQNWGYVQRGTMVLFCI